MRKILYCALAFTLFSIYSVIVFAENNTDYVFDPQDSHHFLYKPDGVGPYPAILLLHASGGIANVNHDWAEKLKERGYVVYMIDSFKPRGFEDRESVGWEVATSAQLSDIAPAYRYLQSQPYVDVNRIGLVGFSMGGFDVLRVMERAESTPEEYQRLSFKVAASFYGVCHRLSPKAKLRGPIKLFIGSEDDRATTRDCKTLVDQSAALNQSITMRVYENALHGFDNFEFPANKEMIDEQGEHYHIGYNEVARQQALQELPEFLDQYLK